MICHCTIRRGKQAGKKLFPHQLADGPFVASPTKFEADYHRSTSLTETLDVAKRRRWKVAMSNPAEGITNRRMVNYESLKFE